MRTHCSNPIENADPIIVKPVVSTSPLASYKEVPPPPAPPTARGRRERGKLEARSVTYSYGCLQVLQMGILRPL